MRDLLPTGALVVREGRGRPFYEAKWRDSTRRQVKRRLGLAWVDREGDVWRRRRGRPREGFLDEKTAIVEMRRAIEEHEATLDKPQLARGVTFDAAAADWLHHLEHIDGVKPSTLANYEYMLSKPNARPRKRGRRRGARVMREFGGQALSAITTEQIDRWLERMDHQAVSKRTINTHRQFVCSVLEYAAGRPERYGITENVARRSAKRREPSPGVLDFYEPEEVAALARAAHEGLHRDPRRPAVSEAEARERRVADEQDAALFTEDGKTGSGAGPSGSRPARPLNASLNGSMRGRTVRAAAPASRSR